MKGSELFPVGEYYKNDIIDAITITRGGSWWSAILLIKDPKTQKNKLIFYKWQKKGDSWITRKSYSINSKIELDKILDGLNEFRYKL